MADTKTKKRGRPPKATSEENNVAVQQITNDEAEKLVRVMIITKDAKGRDVVSEYTCHSVDVDLSHSMHCTGTNRKDIKQLTIQANVVRQTR